MTDDEQSVARFLAVVEMIVQTAPVALDATGAAIIAGVYLGIGSDSRGLSNRLGIAHALVLREINALSGTLLSVVKRDERTQRTWLELTEQGHKVVSDAIAPGV